MRRRGPYYEPLLEKQGLLGQLAESGFNVFGYEHFETNIKHNVLLSVHERAKKFWEKIYEYASREFIQNEESLPQVHIAESLGAPVFLEGLLSNFWDDNNNCPKLPDEGFKNRIERVYFINPVFSFVENAHRFLTKQDKLYLLFAKYYGKDEYLLRQMLTPEYSKNLFKKFNTVREFLKQNGKEDYFPQEFVIISCYTDSGIIFPSEKANRIERWLNRRRATPGTDGIADQNAAPEADNIRRIKIEGVPHFGASQDARVINAVLDDLNKSELSDWYCRCFAKMKAALNNMEIKEIPVSVEDLLDIYYKSKDSCGKFDDFLFLKQEDLIERAI